MEVKTITDFIKSGIDDVITDFTKDGKCSKCGNCCSRFLPLNRDEINKIKEYVKNKDIKKCIHFVPLSKPSLDLACPFRDNNRKICTIYNVRPEICKRFICNAEKRAKENREKLLSDKRKIIDMQQIFFK